MRILSRIVFSKSDLKARRALEAAGLVIPNPNSTSIVIEFDEADARWPGVLEWYQSSHRLLLPLARTLFTKAELEAATWLELNSKWFHGYPLPDDDFGYRSVTYDQAEWCAKCGIHGRQVAPFRIVGEPKWGRRSLIQLYWAYGDFFVTPEAWETVFRPFGIAARPVTNRRGQELSTVVQLVVEDLADVDVEGLSGEECPRCGRRKSHWVTRGFSPRVIASGGTDIARTRQWFGSGGQADQMTIVSQRLRRAMVEAGMKGAAHRPCAMTG